MHHAPRWEFRKMARAELASDPVQGEFFTPQNLEASLVREAIQNSLDAKLEGSRAPVRVRFTFSGPAGALGAAETRAYLKGLRPHLEAQDELGDQLPDPAEPMDFLLIEDFGTAGLTGDPTRTKDPDDPEAGDDFYYFWRNVGRSDKSEKDRGRWGLGKTVFPASSRINAFFGLTYRDDDGRSLLLGQAVLKVHELDDTRHCPYGFFSDYSADDGFSTAIEDADRVIDFGSAFHLSRISEPGLSVVVPYPDREIDAENMVREAIRQYFYPILKGDLEVEIVAPGVEQTLTTQTLGR